jgi:cobalt-precorrin-7 (C5)-methyltransferase
VTTGRNSSKFIVGIGPGDKAYILPKAVEVIESCDYVIGFLRAINSLNFINGNKVYINSLKATTQFIKDNEKSSIAIVASGDPCFYGITDYIMKNYDGKIEVIPGISSFQYLCSKLKKPWQDAKLKSVHGRREEIAKEVLNNKLSVWLTDKESNPNFICKELIRNSIKAEVFVGENLSYQDEKITSGKPEKLVNNLFSDLCVVIVERKGK